MNVAFTGTSELVLSFEAGLGLVENCPVVISQNNRVSAAGDDDVFVGVFRKERCGIASVQLKGYVEFPYSGTDPALGWSTLVADGDGGVKRAVDGLSCLVIYVDASTKTVGFYL